MTQTPSESVSSWLSGLRLHRLTWLIVIAAFLHLAGDTVYTISDLGSYFSRGESATYQHTTLALVLAAAARAYGYSLIYFGTAATVEFLFRIWDELRIRRLSKSPSA